MSYIISNVNDKIQFPERGYFKRGDSGVSIEIIASFLGINFLGYENKLGVNVKDMLGNTFGPNLEKWIKLFQENNKLEVDGCIGPKTLAKLKEYGLE